MHTMATYYYSISALQVCWFRAGVTTVGDWITTLSNCSWAVWEAPPHMQTLSNVRSVPLYMSRLCECPDFKFNSAMYKLLCMHKLQQWLQQEPQSQCMIIDLSTFILCSVSIEWRNVQPPSSPSPHCISNAAEWLWYLSRGMCGCSNKALLIL